MCYNEKPVPGKQALLRCEFMSFRVEKILENGE